ncbi:hypothetical protein SAMN05446935_7469 [Burkholderia sp. YR290]|nr:hypothetical protein SAMN05446935_7469 [Burkholderia sp. YR290]
MNEPLIWMTVPVLSNESAVWFAAYGFGWGYRAFAISYDAVCDSLGAADTTDAEIRLAFSVRKATILQAVQRYGSLPYEGQRIRLSLDVLSLSTFPEEIASMTSSGEPLKPRRRARNAE